MSWVAEAKAAIMKKIKVQRNSPADVAFAAMVSAAGCGKVTVSNIQRTVSKACIAMIHHRFVRSISTNGLQRPFKNHGKYSSVVKKDNWSLGTPILANSITEMLFTKK